MNGIQPSNVNFSEFLLYFVFCKTTNPLLDSGEEFLFCLNPDGCTLFRSLRSKRSQKLFPELRVFAIREFSTTTGRTLSEQYREEQAVPPKENGIIKG